MFKLIVFTCGINVAVFSYPTMDECKIFEAMYKPEKIAMHCHEGNK